MDKYLLTFALFTPGVATLTFGVALLIRSRKSVSIWGARLFYLGFALMFLLPGLGIAALTLLGQLLLPALFGAAFAIMTGFGVLYGLRIHWANPMRRSPDEGQRPLN
jgi:hypothetical protein